MLNKIKNQAGLIIAPLLWIGLCLSGCGTLGGVGKTICFPVAKHQVEKAIDTLFMNHPEYKIPEKWKMYDTWSDRGYSFLESRIFYFESTPEEMYYVSFVDDGLSSSNNKTGIAIRAIFDGNSSGKWLLDKDLPGDETSRIIKRFEDEIVQKLEGYTKTKLGLNRLLGGLSCGR